MKYVVAIAVFLATSPALAESPIVVTLTRDEAQHLRQALDAVVKGGGIEAAKMFMPIDDKLIAAARVAQDIDLTEEARKKVEAADKAKDATKP
jgi:hypothetical protein